MKTQIKNWVTTKKGDVSKNVLNMLLNCRMDEKKHRIYTGYYSGSGRFTSAHSASSTVIDILSVGKFKYTTGNDAPNGGIKGQYIQVSKAAFNAVNEIRKMSKYAI